MAIDPKVSDAISSVVNEYNQSEKVATRLIKWLNALAEGQENFDNDEQVLNWIENILDGIESSHNQDDNEESK
ncbi:MAG: CxC ATPase DNA modification system associated small protein [Halothece sp.]